MKLKELFNKAKDIKTVIILDTVDKEGEVTRQHICIGDAVYPLDGIPLVGEKTLLTMMDVPADKRDEWYVHRREGNERDRWMLADEQITDTDATMGKLTLECNGIELRPIKDEKNIRYRLRKNEKEQLIIAQRGLITIAVLAPSQWANEEEADELWQMATAARKIADSRKKNQT